MFYYEFSANIGISGPNSPGKPIQKKVATKYLPFIVGFNYHQCIDFNEEQRDFLRKMFAFDFNEFAWNVKSFQFTTIEFQLV